MALASTFEAPPPWPGESRDSGNGSCAGLGRGSGLTGGPGGPKEPARPLPRDVNLTAGEAGSARNNLRCSSAPSPRPQGRSRPDPEETLARLTAGAGQGHAGSGGAPTRSVRGRAARGFEIRIAESGRDPGSEPPAIFGRLYRRPRGDGRAPGRNGWLSYGSCDRPRSSPTAKDCRSRAGSAEVHWRNRFGRGLRSTTLEKTAFKVQLYIRRRLASSAGRPPRHLARNRLHRPRGGFFGPHWRQANGPCAYTSLRDLSPKPEVCRWSRGAAPRQPPACSRRLFSGSRRFRRTCTKGSSTGRMGRRM